ncbi:MAG: bifunctional ADP-dependent NAD(P)H-hydrate dehydratase/NAD(P)H-hydrate epimerase [Gordonia sp.]|nr:bifunctional ADP-dependent NAD(P)H-hydrate dehydratase/NAD(P)H-hydrate epimerase [Gordonia sp. (in: high G+C Gram-positive bacteria)]
MIGYFSAEQIRAAEEATGDLLERGVLMGRAAHAVADVVAAELRSRTGGCYGRCVGVLAGAGDNGGDALYAAALLRRRGVRAEAILLGGERTHAAGLESFRRAGGRVVETFSAGIDLVVDGIVGLSGKGPLRPAAAAIVESVTVPIVSVDLPSGVDADTGEVNDPAVRAAVTVTFGAFRIAHVLAAPQCGRTVLADIGIKARKPTLQQLTDAEVAGLWPVPGPSDDKYSQGVVGIVAGSARYPGAGVLCSGAAVSATSGMVRYAGTAGPQVLSHYPEVIATEEPEDAGKVQAWVVGPGAGTEDTGLRRLRHVLDTDVPVLIDADGLTLLAQHRELVVGRTAPTLLTPHAGEFARITGAEVGADRIGAVRGLAAELGVTVLLKGRATVIASPDGDVLVNDARSSWAASAGAGDVLSGIAGSLLAAGIAAPLAAAAAARVHARAAITASAGSTSANTGAAPIGASALVRAVSPTLRALLAERTRGDAALTGWEDGQR